MNQGTKAQIMPKKVISSLKSSTDVGAMVQHVAKNQILNHDKEVALGITIDTERFFWLTPFSKQELEQWWIAQVSFLQMSDDLKILYQACSEPVQTKFRTEEIPGIYIFADDDILWDLFNLMSDSGRHYKFTLCCDTDSFLKAPDGRVILHAGSEGAPVLNAGKQRR